jgi:hypothetical protein
MTLAALGAGLLAIGVFCPLVTLPFIGELDYFRNGEGDGVFVLAIAALSAILLATGHVDHMVWTGLLSGGVTSFTFYEIQSQIGSIQSEMDRNLAGNPFRGLADMAMNTIQIEWGWLVLYAGAACLVTAGAMKDPPASASS